MGIRIAIVDDHPSITWGMSRLIETESPRLEAVGLAHDLDSARDLLRTVQPDVVLLDLDLGGTSAVPLITEFLHAPTRFLVFTGSRDTLRHDEALLAGARGVVLKSEKPELILRAIHCVHNGELWLDRARGAALVDTLRRQAIDRKPDPFAMLTAREREIVAATVEMNGAPNKVVAARLKISEATLRNALSVIYDKTGTGNRLQLFALATAELGRQRSR